MILPVSVSLRMSTKNSALTEQFYIEILENFPVSEELFQTGKVVAERRMNTRWIKEIGDVFFPPSCVICSSINGDVANGLCELCMEKVSYVSSPLCVVCGQNFTAAIPDDHICGDCLRSSPPFTLARSIAFYEEPVRTLLHRLKYNFDTTVVEPLLKIARNYDFSRFENVDYVVPVPLHSQRLRKRGFNHAQYLARLFFPERPRDIVVDSLVKKRNTVSQTALDATRRKANLRAAFFVKDTEMFRNKKVCVVDDVYTTGTTVTECAKTLRQGGAADVIVITFARVWKK